MFKYLWLSRKVQDMLLKCQMSKLKCQNKKFYHENTKHGKHEKLNSSLSCL